MAVAVKALAKVGWVRCTLGRSSRWTNHRSSSTHLRRITTPLCLDLSLKGEERTQRYPAMKSTGSWRTFEHHGRSEWTSSWCHKWHQQIYTVMSNSTLLRLYKTLLMWTSALRRAAAVSIKRSSSWQVCACVTACERSEGEERLRLEMFFPVFNSDNVYLIIWELIVCCFVLVYFFIIPLGIFFPSEIGCEELLNNFLCTLIGVLFLSFI